MLNASEHNRRVEKAHEKNKELGEGVHEGKVIRFHVADGYAYYEITEVGEEVCRVKYREDLCPDRYRSDAVTEDGRIFREALEKACSRMDFHLENFA